MVSAIVLKKSTLIYIHMYNNKVKYNYLLNSGHLIEHFLVFIVYRCCTNALDLPHVTNDF